MADAADFRRIALSLEGGSRIPAFRPPRVQGWRVTFATLAPDKELTANIKFRPRRAGAQMRRSPRTPSPRSTMPGAGGAGRARRSPPSARPSFAPPSRWLAPWRRQAEEGAAGPLNGHLQSNFPLGVPIDSCVNRADEERPMAPARLPPATSVLATLTLPTTRATPALAPNRGPPRSLVSAIIGS